MYRLSLLVLLAASLASAATTTIADNVNSISAVVGDAITTLSISYGSFTGTDGTPVTAGSTSPTLTNGTFSVALTPNAATSGVYTVTYTGTSGHTYVENWTVPISGTALVLSHVRAPGDLLTRNDSTTYLVNISMPAPGSVASIPRTINAAFDGGGSALTSGKTVYSTIPFACTLAGWDIQADTGTATVKLWKSSSTTAIPTSANSINTSGVSLSSGTRVHSSTMTDFTTTSVAANDQIAVTLSAVSSATYVQVTVQCNE